MRKTAATLRDAGLCLLLAIGTSSSTVASAGQGVWTNNGPFGGDIRALAIDPSNPATVYAGTYGGVFKSTDSGGTWTAFNTGLSDLHILALAIDPANHATLYAGAFGGGVFKSTNSGGTWAAVNTGLASYYPYVQALAINPVASSL